MEFDLKNMGFSDFNKESFDLLVYQCGMEECNPSHSYGPVSRDHFLIHFILEGSGTFYVDGKSYRLSKNQGFLICPDILTYYEADNEDPWVYTWVGFKGIKAENYLRLANLDRQNPIFTYEDGDYIKYCFENIRMAKKLKYGSILRLQGFLSVFLSELIEKAEKPIIEGSSYKEIYIKKIMLFIETNYSRNISIPDIAKYIGLNKNYFSSFFKENLGITPQEYLITYRINKACELLKNTQYSVSEISRSVGYTDPLGFSKIFKKIKGCSPKDYRLKIHGKT